METEGNFSSLQISDVSFYYIYAAPTTEGTEASDATETSPLQADGAPGTYCITTSYNSLDVLIYLSNSKAPAIGEEPPEKKAKTEEAA